MRSSLCVLMMMVKAMVMVIMRGANIYGVAISFPVFDPMLWRYRNVFFPLSISLLMNNTEIC